MSRRVLIRDVTRGHIDLSRLAEQRGGCLGQPLDDEPADLFWQRDDPTEQELRAVEDGARA